MNVFFTVAYHGNQQFGKYYKLLYNEIKHLGYTHLDDEAITTTSKDYIEKMSQGRSVQVANYRNKMKNLQDADICVVEASSHNLGGGYVIEKSLQLSKPTIVLYHKNNIPFFLTGIEDEKLVVISYNEDNYKKVLADSFATAKEKRDKRFNFFISPELLDYLSQQSKLQGITKSAFIRTLLKQHRKRAHKQED